MNTDMKKLSTLTSGISYLLLAATTFAQGNIQIKPPESATDQPVGYTNISDFLNASLILVFIVALIIVLVMLVWGAVSWILSGGDDDAIKGARNRIIHALVGLAILAVAFALVNLAGTFVGIDLLGDLKIPTPSSPTPFLPTPKP